MNIVIEEYNKKWVILRNNDYNDSRFKNLGGTFIKSIKTQNSNSHGWLFPLNKKEEIIQKLSSYNITFNITDDKSQVLESKTSTIIRYQSPKLQEIINLSTHEEEDDETDNCNDDVNIDNENNTETVDTSMDDINNSSIPTSTEKNVLNTGDNVNSYIMVDEIADTNNKVGNSNLNIVENEIIFLERKFLSEPAILSSKKSYQLKKRNNKCVLPVPNLPELIKTDTTVNNNDKCESINPCIVPNTESVNSCIVPNTEHINNEQIKNGIFLEINDGYATDNDDQNNIKNKNIMCHCALF